MSAVWTDELKEQVKAMYLEAEPTPETTSEIIKEIADNIDKTANGVRMVLQKMEVYVKKDASTSPDTSDKPASKKVSKADAQAALSKAIEDAGCEVDEEIIAKLTGKAAVYLTGVITNKD